MDYDMKQLQSVQLELLDELMRVCRDNDIPLYVAAGSCIGAVRHQGFIPWDDDIDVFMYADDVDRLFACRDQFGSSFFLQDHTTDPGYTNAIARLRKRGTACVERDDADMKCHHGIFLDIYLLYYYPANKVLRAKMFADAVLHTMLLAGHPPLNHGRAVAAAGRVMLLPYKNEKKRREKIRRLEKELRKYRDTDDLVIMYGMDISLKRIISYKTAWFQKPAQAMFEGRQVPVATDAHAYLTRRYGDYMKLPPEDKRHSYHSYVFVSFDREYNA